VNRYLNSKYKLKDLGNLIPSKPSIPASQRIESELGSDYVVRHRKEVLEDYIETLRRERIP